MEVGSQAISRVARSYLWSIGIWLSLAPLAAGEEKVGLLDRGLYLPYWTLLLAISHVLIAWSRANEDQLAHKIWPIQNDLLSHKTADREPEQQMCS